MTFSLFVETTTHTVYVNYKGMAWNLHHPHWVKEVPQSWMKRHSTLFSDINDDFSKDFWVVYEFIIL